ncbi:MAG: hypothetical protein MZU95_08035, partial [Desulfomicrobium escambiense]|nr:hypothetical protein [Desulfomicrobium escambiense]
MLLRKLVDIQYERNDIDFNRGTLPRAGRRRRNPARPTRDQRDPRRVLRRRDRAASASSTPLTGEVSQELRLISIFPATHYVTEPRQLERGDRADPRRAARSGSPTSSGTKQAARGAAHRAAHRCTTSRCCGEMGSCNGIENYSRHLDAARRRRAAVRPCSTIFPSDFLLIVDESHVDRAAGARHVQRRPLAQADARRLRLPAAVGARQPAAQLRRVQRARSTRSIYVSATPGDYELRAVAEQVVEQIIRPTGLDRSRGRSSRQTEGQIDDLIGEIRKRDRAQGARARDHAHEEDGRGSDRLPAASWACKVAYLHSESRDRSSASRSSASCASASPRRAGRHQPAARRPRPARGLARRRSSTRTRKASCAADRSLVQTIGRAARNVNGKVVMYADQITESMQYAIDETNRRRAIQIAHNEKNHIVPKTILKPVHESRLDQARQDDRRNRLQETLEEGLGEIDRHPAEADDGRGQGARLRTRRRAPRRDHRNEGPPGRRSTSSSGRASSSPWRIFAMSLRVGSEFRRAFLVRSPQCGRNHPE